MIQSLSDRQRKKKTKIRRIFFVSVTILLLIGWTFLRPVFLIVLDPFVLMYSRFSGSFYAKYQKVEAFFASKDKTLSYVRALEEENSRLHNKLALIENGDCGLKQEVQEEGSGDILASSSASSSLSILSTSIDQHVSSKNIDPCFFTKRIEPSLDAGDFLKVSPLLSHISYLFDTVRINRGATDGLEEGDVVFTRGMMVIGKVLSVSKHSSLVELYSKEGVELYGTLPSGDSFKVLGVGGGSYEAEVPKSIVVKVGDKVLFTWNQDLILGEVAGIEAAKQDVSQKISIRGGFNPAKLPVMYIENHE